jgi:hypothetical protein
LEGSLHGGTQKAFCRPVGLKKSLMTGRGVGDSHLRGSTSCYRRGRLPGASAGAERVLATCKIGPLPTWFSFFSGPVAVPRAGACRARCACICQARSVPPACAGTRRTRCVLSLNMQAVQRQEARKAGQPPASFQARPHSPVQPYEVVRCSPPRDEGPSARGKGEGPMPGVLASATVCHPSQEDLRQGFHREPASVAP